MAAYNACRLIPLDKSPGVRPIGFGEVLRRIIGRSILKCLSNDLKLLSQSDQLCLGQKCGIEHAIHALRHEFETPQSEAMFLIDAENAFNSLNCKRALKNIEILCPSHINALRNSFESPFLLFINGKTILSHEGRSQGDPLAMAMFGVALLPLINLVKDDIVNQKWFADDGNAVGSLESLVALHQKVQKHGPAFGYKLTKCNLIVKESSLEKAKKSFNSIDIEIVPGHRVLGSTIGSEAACDEFSEKVTTEYQHQVEKLAIHDRKSPQNVYHAFTHGIQNKPTFLSRTKPDIEPFLQETEITISEKLLPALTGETTHTEEQRLLFSLALKMAVSTSSHPMTTLGTIHDR